MGLGAEKKNNAAVVQQNERNNRNNEAKDALDLFNVWYDGWAFRQGEALGANRTT